MFQAEISQLTAFQPVFNRNREKMNMTYTREMLGNQYLADFIPEFLSDRQIFHSWQCPYVLHTGKIISTGPCGFS